ncbi:uncharacterized protein LOC100181772 [Ciona intestinalis]
MSDGTGLINLNSLASNNGTPTWTIQDSYGWQYEYNPCVGFTSLYYSNLAILQSSIYNTWDEYDLGSQLYESFIYRAAEGVSVEYYAQDQLRKSRVTLVCEPETTEHELKFLGELIITEYEFVLTGPCGCPGLCDDNGLLSPGTTTTTVPSNTDTTTPSGNAGPEPVPKPGVNWDIVGASLVALIFHDLILLFVVSFILVLLKFVFNIACCSNSASKYSTSMQSTA